MMGVWGLPEGEFDPTIALIYFGKPVTLCYIMMPTLCIIT